MKCIYVLLAMVAAVSGWRLSDMVREEWQTFKLKHNKQYGSAKKERHRMVIYLKKRHMIAKHNKRYHSGQESFRLKINQFSDMTHEEYLKIASGFKPQSRRKSKDPATMFMSPANVKINETVDWRQLGAVSRIRNQLKCQSSWAFSATGALEGQLFRKNKTLVPLSPQNLIDCSKKNCACKHGDVKTTFQYIQENKGIDSEENYPYKAKKKPCRYNPKDSVGYNVGFQGLPEGNEETLKIAVATIGPVSASIDASLESFASYSEGVYYDEKCSTNVNHAVLVVGYGTDNCDGDYWLLKNSYGTTWGEKGYMRLVRNRTNHCGIASYALYPLIPQ